MAIHNPTHMYMAMHNPTQVYIAIHNPTQFLKLFIVAIKIINPVDKTKLSEHNLVLVCFHLGNTCILHVNASFILVLIIYQIILPFAGCLDRALLTLHSCHFVMEARIHTLPPLHWFLSARPGIRDSW